MARGNAKGEGMWYRGDLDLFSVVSDVARLKMARQLLDSMSGEYQSIVTVPSVTSQPSSPIPAIHCLVLSPVHCPV